MRHSIIAAQRKPITIKPRTLKDPNKIIIKRWKETTYIIICSYDLVTEIFFQEFYLVEYIYIELICQYVAFFFIVSLWKKCQFFGDKNKI